MNLSAYDAVEIKCEKGSWVNPRFKRLYTTDIDYHPYCAFLKRYNNKLRSTDYFLALLDEESSTSDCHSVVRTKNGMIKIDLKPIWNNTFLCGLTDKTLISVELIEKTEDGAIYSLNV